ncbi:MAG: hypothetical protein WCC60_04930 [Ilumatobacteraceae bacterium]
MVGVVSAGTVVGTTVDVVDEAITVDGGALAGGDVTGFTIVVEGPDVGSVWCVVPPQPAAAATMAVLSAINLHLMLDGTSREADHDRALRRNLRENHRGLSRPA